MRLLSLLATMGLVGLVVGAAIGSVVRRGGALVIAALVGPALSVVITFWWVTRCTSGRWNCGENGGFHVVVYGLTNGVGYISGLATGHYLRHRRNRVAE